MRLYISGPITDCPNYKRNFATAQSILQEMGHTDIVNPAELERVMPDIEKMNHEEIIQVCFEFLSRCDAMLMLPGWNKSTGCMAEWGYAQGQGNIIIVEFEDYIKGRGCT